MKQKILFALLMGTVTTFVVSLTVILINVGYVNGFYAKWLKSWLISYLVAVPCIILLGPKIQHLVNHLLGLKQKQSA